MPAICYSYPSPSTTPVLREHKEKQEATRAKLGIQLIDDDLIFSDLNGKPLLPNTVTHAWIKLVRRVGLKGIRLHDTRHTHASLMLKQGTHPKIVQEGLGNASIQITLDTYSNVAPGLQEAAAARFDEAFGNRYNKHENKAVTPLGVSICATKYPLPEPTRLAHQLVTKLKSKY